ncbi:MAG: cytochrome b5 [Cyclobacteriaceae bacterium]|nr:cytochrome b5 [Cyclobacteriaceae bacterium]MCH8514947.1 cytochrome b5 [Cyclobacteriaceae bacterium]
MSVLDKEKNLPHFSVRQLALRNGSDREEIWCAYKGVIYDLSRSRLWKNGKHYEHFAGQDLTAEMADAPHLDTVFDKFEPIGLLI